jgi:hypothetical protein
MPAIRLIVWKSASCVLTLLLLASAAAGRTNSVMIGTVTYVVTNEFGSAFRVTLDPSLVTAQLLSFASVTVFVDSTSRASGALTTPVTLLYIGGTVKAFQQSVPIALNRDASGK